MGDDAGDVAEAINRFALDLYQHFQQQNGNLFFSPTSLSTALAMTYAGARSKTEAEMAKALHVSRTPLREALQRLRNAGLVTQSPHGG